MRRLSLTYHNEELSLSEWAARTHIPYSVLYARIRLGWEPGRILTTPPKQVKQVRVGKRLQTVKELSTQTGLPRATLYSRLHSGAQGNMLLNARRMHAANPHVGSVAFRQWLFDFLVHYKGAHDGVAPSLREIQGAAQTTPAYTGISIGSIKWGLHELDKEGRIILTRNQPRSIQVRGGEWQYKGDGRG